MKPSKRVKKAISFVATLLLLGGLSVAQEPKAKDWGNPVDGLQNAHLSRPGGDWAVQGSEVQS